MDLEARARADRKRVPILVTTLLTYLDDRKSKTLYTAGTGSIRLIAVSADYPELEGDEARRAIWLYDVPLEATHRLRTAMNNSKADYRKVLEDFDMPIVASVLKLYLLELPDSLVSSQVYEIIKTVYSTTAHETTEEGRIKVLQSTLGQLRLNNIATLDAIMTHFTRLIDLTSADEAYCVKLAQSLSQCILRPRIESSLTMDERHSYRLIQDLFAHKDVIFGELKRQSGANGVTRTNSRPRAISTDESNRRAAMEARNRAIVDRSRAHSPAPPRSHRRDRSSGASETRRFPINVNSPTEKKSGTRSSLDVPSSNSSPTEAGHLSNVNINAAEYANNATPSDSPVSGAASATSSGTSSPPPPPTTAPDDSPTPTPTPAPVQAAVSDIEKRTSLSRTSVKSTRKPGLGSISSFPTGAGSGTNSNRTSVADNEPQRVTLEDKPMDD